MTREAGIACVCWCVGSASDFTEGNDFELVALGALTFVQLWLSLALCGLCRACVRRAGIYCHVQRRPPSGELLDVESRHPAEQVSDVRVAAGRAGNGHLQPRWQEKLA